LVAAAVIAYFIWHSILGHRASVENIALIDHAKTVMSDDAKKVLFTAENNIASLTQSDSTKKIVK
jgi:hypothetical protein